MAFVECFQEQRPYAKRGKVPDSLPQHFFDSIGLFIGQAAQKIEGEVDFFWWFLADGKIEGDQLFLKGNDFPQTLR